VDGCCEVARGGRRCRGSGDGGVKWEKSCCPVLFSTDWHEFERERECESSLLLF